MNYPGFPSEMHMGVPAGQPPRKDGWQVNGKLYRGNAERTVRCQADFPESGTYTVQFGFQAPTAVGALGTQALADITWFTEGNAITRRVDVANGVSVTGVGQGVTVTIYDNSNSGGEEYSVSCSVAKGARPSQDRPPTLQTTNYADGSGIETVDIQIPQGVGVISALVFATNQVTASGLYVPTELLVAARNPAFIDNFSIYNPDVLTGFVPIPPGATFLRLHFSDADATHDHKYNVIWGIDG